MIRPEECVHNILSQGTINILGVKSQYTVFAAYSPELLLSCTPPGDISKGEAYFSQVYYQDMSIVFSRNKESPTLEVLELSFSGGDRTTRLDILSEFESYLDKRQEQQMWQSILRVPDVEVDMYRWNVVVSG